VVRGTEADGSGTAGGRPKDPCRLVEAFEAVRDLPYALDGAHDADELIALGRGDCLAKSDLLARKLTELGLEARLVRFRYLLPSVVPEVEALPERTDLHRAVQVGIGGNWILVDATHDPPLGRGGLTVGHWDGSAPTEPAYPPAGPLLVEGLDDEAIRLELEQISRWVRETDPAVVGRWHAACKRRLAELQETVQ
jgi:transglutaminase-like putative cysteine protease